MIGEYEDYEPTEEEEMQSHAERARWEELHAAWLDADYKCRCGQPISLADAFYYGECDNCRLNREV